MANKGYDRISGMLTDEQFAAAIGDAAQNSDPTRGLSKGAGYHVGRVTGAALGVGLAGTVGVASLGVKVGKVANKGKNKIMSDISYDIASFGSKWMEMCGVLPVRVDPRLAEIGKLYADKDQKNGYQMGG